MNGEANTFYVEEAARSFAERLQDGKQYTVVVNCTHWYEPSRQPNYSPHSA